MKFIITRQNEGSFDEVGTNNRSLWGDLKTVKGAIRRARKIWPDVGLRIEVFRGNVYGEPSQTIFVK